MKKKLNIVLLFLVLCLWGVVIYKYVNQYFSKAEPLGLAALTNHSTTNKIIKKDTFELNPIGRDPFLGSSTGIKRIRINSTRIYRMKEIKKELPKPTKFPNVQYYGYIKAIDKAQETVLMSIEGRFSRLHLNQEKDGLKVTVLNKDSIKVYFNKESKWIRFKKK